MERGIRYIAVGGIDKSGVAGSLQALGPKDIGHIAVGGIDKSDKPDSPTHSGGIRYIAVGGIDKSGVVAYFGRCYIGYITPCGIDKSHILAH